MSFELRWRSSGTKNYPVERLRMKLVPGGPSYDEKIIGKVYGSPTEHRSANGKVQEVTEFRAHDILDDRAFFLDLAEAKKWVEERARKYAQSILKFTGP